MTTSVLKALLLHPATRLQVEQVLRNPPQVLLIVGPSGSGKKTIAKAVAAEALQLKEPGLVDTYPYFVRVSRPEGKQEIPIDSVRKVIKTLQLKTPGRTALRRIVLIEEAETLGHAAQNALLKTLEETSQETLFILTAASPNYLLPTVVSRAQLLPVHPVGLAEAQRYWLGKYPKSAIGSNWQLSQGSVSLMQAMLSAEQVHPLKEAVERVKVFLKKTPYVRLLAIDSLSKNRVELEAFLDAFSRVVAALQRASLQKGHQKQAKALLSSRQELNEAKKALAANVSPRLVALYLVLKLPI